MCRALIYDSNHFKYLHKRQFTHKLCKFTGRVIKKPPNPLFVFIYQKVQLLYLKEMNCFLVTKTAELLACVVDLDLFVDVIEDGFHLVLQAIELTSFPLQLSLVLLIVFLQLCGKRDLRNGYTARHEQHLVPLSGYLIILLYLGADFNHQFLLNRLLKYTGLFQTAFNWLPIYVAPLSAASGYLCH